MSQHSKITRSLLTLGTVLVLMTACTPPPRSAASPTAASSAAATPASNASGSITVFAAASLKDAFNEMGAAFERQHPGTQIRFNYAGSQQLADQIGLGAPADVFASANQKLMDAIVKTERIEDGPARTFAHNRLIVVVPQANRAGIRTLQDLARPGIKLVLAAPAVPVGSYTLDFLKKASAQPDYGATYSQTVLANVVSYEQDVRSVFAKVALDEADAGVVYASDVQADKATAVSKIDIPDALNTVATYPIAPLKDSPNLALAEQFVAYVISPDGQTILTKYGFIPIS